MNLLLSTAVLSEPTDALPLVVQALLGAVCAMILLEALTGIVFEVTVALTVPFIVLSVLLNAPFTGGVNNRQRSQAKRCRCHTQILVR